MTTFGAFRVLTTGLLIALCCPLLAQSVSEASPQAIQQRCGRASRIYQRTAGHGATFGEEVHLFYPQHNMEITAVRAPNDPKPAMRVWVFGGAWKPGTESRYSNATLAKQMPCLAEWSNAAAKEDASLGLN